MNLLLLFDEEEIRPDVFRVERDRAAHLIRVLQAEPGQVLHVGRLDGPTGTAEVLEVRTEAVELRIVELAPPLPRSTTRLLLAVPRPKVLRRLLPQLAALGLDELVLMRTWRVDRSHLHPDLLTPTGYRPLLHEGLMQACLTHEPKVRFEPRFRPYVEDRLPDERSSEVRVVAHPRAAEHLAHLTLGPARGRAVAIGPERGFIDGEVELLERARFRPARLGVGVLKVETACVVALAQLELRT